MTELDEAFVDEHTRDIIKARDVALALTECSEIMLPVLNLLRTSR